MILLGTRVYENSIDDLINQIDPRDWLASYSAVSALQEFSNEKARQALQRVAKTYWHPIVRNAAAEKLEADPNLSQYPAEEARVVKLPRDFLQTQRSPVYEMQEAEITGWCKARFDRDGYRFVPDFITGPDVAAQAGEASDFNGDHFEKMLLGLDVMKGTTKLDAQMKFEGWSFLGSVSDGRSDQSPAGESRPIGCF